MMRMARWRRSSPAPRPTVLSSLGAHSAITGAGSCGATRVVPSRCSSTPIASSTDRQAAFEDVAPMRRIVVDDAGRWSVRGGEGAVRGWQDGRPSHRGRSAAVGDGQASTERCFCSATSADGARPRATRGRRRVRGGAGRARPVVGRRRGLGAARANRARLGGLAPGGGGAGRDRLIVGVRARLTRQQRRAQGLADALRLAEATAALRERSEKLVESVPLGVIASTRGARHRGQSVPRRSRARAPRGSLPRRSPGSAAEERAPLEALLATEAPRRAQRPSARACALTLDGK